MTIFSVFFSEELPANFFVILSVTSSPKKQSYLKDKLLKERFGIIVLFYIRTKSLCISRPPVKWSLFLTENFFFLMLVPIFLCTKITQKNFASKEPCASVCSPYFARWNQNKI